MGTPTFSSARATALPVVGIHHSCCREILRLKADNERLREALDGLRAEHEDLRKSAELWIRLYENQVAQATKRAGVTASCRP